MKHIQYFDKFLKDHVNLNQTRLDTLGKKVNIVTDLLKLKLPNYAKYGQQGSYAHGTIIKPVKGNDEFDADILIFIKDSRFHPNSYHKDYVTEIYGVIRDDANYQIIVRRKSRCVTIDYSGDFHLDLVPCVEYFDKKYICNRDDRKYEQTDGDGYKDWFADKNRIVGENKLKKATRLFKFLRDHKNNFAVSSVLLTTILGNQITINDKDYAEFRDLPQTLKTLSNRVNAYLQTNSNMPSIWNPVLPGENFNRKWDQRKYRNFREKFGIYNQKINDAFEEKDHNESIRKWRKLFGDDFGELTNANASAAAAGIFAAVTSPSVHATKPYASGD